MKTNNKKHRGLPNEILTEDEVQSLIGACSHQSSTGIRNRALITILYRGGLRIGEALGLYIRDVDPRAGILRVTNSKTQKTRFVRIDPMSFDVLRRWCDRRATLGLNGKNPLFSTLSGETLKQAYVRALLPRLGRTAGIEKRCHAHALRHTHAAELARKQIPVDQIQLHLGHASKASTIRYISAVSPNNQPGSEQMGASSL
jgi:site-specific recombinase XerD